MTKHKNTHQKKSSNKLQKNQKEKEEEVPIEVAEVIKDLPKEKQETLIKAFAVRQHYSGPLPDGDSIKIYDDVIPNGGDRLMNTVEKQLDHRIEIENTGVKRPFNQSSTGQWMGFAIAIIFGFIAWDLAKSGFTVVASILGTVDLVALVAVFITGKLTK